MTEVIKVFDIKLGNCGTSKLFSVTLDNDCIVIKGKNPRKVVLKFLKNDKNSIEVRFFNKEGNTYYKKFNLGNTDDGNTRSLLNVAAFLFYNSTGPNYDINLDAALRSSFYPPDKLKTLGATTINLFNAIIIFVATTKYEDQFVDNVNIIDLEKIIKAFNDKYITPTETASTNVATVSPLPLSSSSSSETDPPKVTTQPESSRVATKPLLGATSKYVTLFRPEGNIYYNINSDGSYDINNPLTTPPTGGSNKRYRKSRKSRKYQSRRKSRRHIRKRVRTHRRKSRKSRK
jgi:hypothetical protein